MTKRAKKKVRTGFICLAAGLLAGAGIWYLAGHKPSASAFVSRRPEESKEIWLLGGDYPAGTRLTKAMLEKGRVPLAFTGAGTSAEKDITGCTLKLNLTGGTILTEDLLYGGEETEDDLRLHRYDFIKLTDKMKTGDYVDIRIFFPDGTDFIVLSKKRIEDLSAGSGGENIPGALWLRMNEEEILRISSAYVDALLRKGSSIYAIAYACETQEPAAVTYPVSEPVKNLMEENPNITNKEGLSINENFRKAINKTGGSQREPSTEEGVQPQPTGTEYGTEEGVTFLD